MKHVIIGNGIAGIMAAETIRSINGEDEIVMIGDETVEPYCRPMISMFLEGSVGHEKLPIRGREFYKVKKIEPVLGYRVESMDLSQNTVTISDGKTVSYDKLLVATGADPRPIKAEGLELENIFFMRTERHVKQMVEALSDCKRALVLGGGLVGFKAAYGLMHRGLDVTMLIRSGYPLSMQIDETAGYMILDELKKKGLKVHVGIEARRFKGDGKVETAVLSNGSEISCDMVVIGKGVLPSLLFIPEDKIHVDLGIVVNPYMETTQPGIYAAGDVAEFIDIARNRRWVNAIWPEAVSQGRIAGMNMAGIPVPYRGSLSRNVIRIFDLDVMACGIASPPVNEEYRIYQHHEPGKRLYRRLVFKNDILVGFVLVNSIENGGLLMSIVRNGKPVNISPEVMIRPAFNFKQLFSE